METTQTIPSLSVKFLDFLQVPSSAYELAEKLPQQPSVLHLQKILNYKFKDYSLLLKAITHRSFAHEFSNINGPLDNSERLEFLGDSLLAVATSLKIFEKHSTMAEGKMSKLRGSIVNESVLAQLALEFQLDSLLLVGKGEFNRDGQKNSASLADMVEAIFAAIYLDSDIVTCLKVIESLFEKSKKNFFNEERLEQFDPKTSLQELSVKTYKTLPRYESQQLDNGKFKISLFINNKLILEEVASSKKKGEMAVAKKAMQEKHRFFGITN